VTAKLIGINHVALEVDDIDAALDWYGRFFEFSLRGKSRWAAFIDIGDQFIALERGRLQEPDRGRHFGLVVDDKEAARRALLDAGVAVSSPPSLDFRDPWGNHVQVVDYREIQFLKAPEVLRALDAKSLEKTERALGELRAKGIYEAEPR
jgi:catechol 2,3-dioxygenase-like lactoylglutathione lyase family enzyme